MLLQVLNKVSLVVAAKVKDSSDRGGAALCGFRYNVGDDVLCAEGRPWCRLYDERELRLNLLDLCRDLLDWMHLRWRRLDLLDCVHLRWRLLDLLRLNVMPRGLELRKL